MNNTGVLKDWALDAGISNHALRDVALWAALQGGDVGRLGARALGEMCLPMPGMGQHIEALYLELYSAHRSRGQRFIRASSTAVVGHSYQRRSLVSVCRAGSGDVFGAYSYALSGAETFRGRFTPWVR